MAKKILVIDDDRSILEAMETIFTDMGITVRTCSNAVNGTEIAVSEDYDLILVDVRMPDKNGAEVTRSILENKPDAKVFIITGYPSDPVTKQSLEAGAKGMIKKPFEIGKILDFLVS